MIHLLQSVYLSEHITCELSQANATAVMLARMLNAACLLLMVIVQLCSSSAVYHDYIVVGAGPAGLQLGYFFQRAGRDYVVLERGTQAGARVT